MLNDSSSLWRARAIDFYSGFHHTQTTNFLSEYLPDLKGALLSPEDLWDEALGRVLLAFLLFPLAFV